LRKARRIDRYVALDRLPHLFVVLVGMSALRRRRRSCMEW
jgi:hypothetical protein